jgi:hypothetical protein
MTDKRTIKKKISEKWMTSSTVDKFNYLRFILSGAIVGIAIIGTGFWLFGYEQRETWDIMAGAIGGGLSAAGLKSFVIA